MENKKSLSLFKTCTVSDSMYSMSMYICTRERDSSCVPSWFFKTQFSDDSFSVFGIRASRSVYTTVDSRKQGLATVLTVAFTP